MDILGDIDHGILLSIIIAFDLMLSVMSTDRAARERHASAERVAKPFNPGKIGAATMKAWRISMTVIELPDEQAAALKAKAAAAGLTLEAWLNKLAGTEASVEQQRPIEKPLQTAADIVLDLHAQRPA